MDAAEPDWLVSQLNDITRSGSIVSATLGHESWRIRYVDGQTWPAASLPRLARIAFASEDVVAFIGHDLPPYAISETDDLSEIEFLALQYDNNLTDGVPVYWWHLDDGMPRAHGRASRLCLGPGREVVAIVDNGVSVRDDEVVIFGSEEHHRAVAYDGPFDRANCMPVAERRPARLLPNQGSSATVAQYLYLGLMMPYAMDPENPGNLVQLRDADTDDVLIDRISTLWSDRLPTGPVYSPPRQAIIAWDLERARELRMQSGDELEQALREECISLSRIDLSPEPRETVTCAPGIPGAFWFYPIDGGLLVASNHLELPHSRANRLAGLYFAPAGDDPPIRILDSYVDGMPAVSPSGCRIAFSIGPFPEAATRRFTDSPIIAVIEIC